MSFPLARSLPLALSRHSITTCTGAQRGLPHAQLMLWNSTTLGWATCRHVAAQGRLATQATPVSIGHRWYSARVEPSQEPNESDAKGAGDKILKATMGPPPPQPGSEAPQMTRAELLAGIRERHKALVKELADEAAANPKPKQSRLEKFYEMVKHGLEHTWDGFKLLATNTRVTWGILKKMRRGEVLSRREQSLLMLTTADLVRIIPFSFFIIVPGAELLLPVAIKIFPGMLPSTFAAKVPDDEYFSEQPMRMKHKRLLAHFFVEVAYIAPSLTEDQKYILEKIKLGEYLSAEEIQEVTPLVKGRVALTKLDHQICHSLCVLLNVCLGRDGGLDPPGPPRILLHAALHNYISAILLKTSGTADTMRTRIQKRIAVLKGDDRLILRDGVPTLTRLELVMANRKRTMRHALLSTEGLQQQLQDWIELSADPAVPNLVLFFATPQAKASFEKSKLGGYDQSLSEVVSKLLDSKTYDDSGISNATLRQVKMMLDDNAGARKAREDSKKTAKEKLKIIHEQENAIMREKKDAKN